MKKGRITGIFALITVTVMSFSLVQCKKKPETQLPQCTPSDSIICGKQTPYPVNIPSHFPPIPDFPDNPITVEGVALGKKLFYDNVLSDFESTSCNSCHKQQFNFALPGPGTADVNGIAVARNVMPLVNLAYIQNHFGWDGRKATLESKIENSIENPFTVNGKTTIFLPRLKADQDYVDMYYAAFCEEPTMENTCKALAQFFRIIISGNAKIDQLIQGKPGVFFTAEESNGLTLFNTDRDINNNIMGADCFHCHGGVNPFNGQGNVLFSDFLLHNNGLDSTFEKDAGYAYLSGVPADSGLFRTPSLRNIPSTAPFMHDGRFATLDDVIEFYSDGIHWSTTIDPLMKNVNDGGVQLSAQAKSDLKAFILTLNDTTLNTNPEFMP